MQYFKICFHKRQPEAKKLIMQQRGWLIIETEVLFSNSDSSCGIKGKLG